MKKAFVIGNGTSRQGFHLEKLKDKGVIFGCNLLYQDFSPDYIVAIDETITKTLLSQTEFPQHRIIIPPEDEQYELSGTGKRSNAGMNAMLEAIKRGCNVIYCLGFDFLKLDEKESVSNIYEDQYGNRANHEDNINRVKYLIWFANKYPSVQFVFVFKQDTKEIHTIPCGNVVGMYYDQLEKELDNGTPT